jgi:hypothetical protein
LTTDDVFVTRVKMFFDQFVLRRIPFGLSNLGAGNRVCKIADISVERVIIINRELQTN